MRRSQPWNKSNKIRFLFSGTIAEVYGVKEAISFHKAINKHYISTITIAGHCPNNETFKFLEKEATNNPSIRLNISSTPVDHQEIIDLYSQSDFALTPYLANKSTENCIPVKFYEYVAHQVPIIIPDDNPYWMAFLSDYQAFHSINFRDFFPKEVVECLKEKDFYPLHPPDSIYWKSEEVKLLTILVNVLRR